MNMAATHIKQRVMLDEMDIRRLPNGSRILFSIKFVLLIVPQGIEIISESGSNGKDELNGRKCGPWTRHC